MKIIFLGTPYFSVKPLNALLHSGHQIVGVVTNPDKVNARGNKIVFSEVKDFALKNNLLLFQFESIKKQGVQILKSLNADVMITASYGQILNQEIIDICKYGVLNIHASLLPKYRGASPIIQALLNGDKKTGVTIMQTQIGMDDGDMLLKKEIEIEDCDNQETLIEKLSILGANAIVEVLNNIEYYLSIKQKQDESMVSHCYKISKDEALLDFSLNAEVLNNKVRAFYKNPTTYFKLNDLIYKVFECEVVHKNFNSYGEVVSYDKNNGFIISCGENALSIKLIQKQGGKVLQVKDFMNGNKIEVGQKLNV